ncbi:MAG: 2-C-methyl-D-erythritol 4-phosphate cytidylyltransferase [Candidatus Gastranaerophilales bacterium]|nr:2-C-methyl-D-erythritol 4-phosphate cytidylyltransferase [Candidatus Gastranaerophilales bacterium]
MKISAIIPAAGSGSRFSQSKNKLLEDINGTPVIIHTLKKFIEIKEINEIVVCTSNDIIDGIKDLLIKNNLTDIKVILGGKTRQESVFLGLQSCNNPDIVAIHDGARPLIDISTIKDCIDNAINKGASIVAVPTKDTIKRVDKNLKITETINRSELWNIQTPQVFRYKEILAAHKKFIDKNKTDDAALAEDAGIKVYITKGSYKNIKITTKEDMQLAGILM